MKLAIAAVPLVCCAALVQGAAVPDWVEESNRYANRVLEAQAEFTPEGASAQGLDAFDGEVMDLRPGNWERAAASSRALLAELEAALSREQDPKVRQDLDILIAATRDSIESSEVYRRHLLPYMNLHQQIFFGFNRLLDPRTGAERHEAAKARLAKYAGAADGYEPIVDLAIARTRERFEIEGLLGPYRGEIEADLGNAPRLVAGLRSLFEGSGLDGWWGDLDLLVAQLERYAEWLRVEMVARARPESQLPAEVYAINLRNFGVRSSPDELIAQAQYSYQLLRSEMKAVAAQVAAQRGWADDDLMSVLFALKKEQVPQDRLLDLFRERLEVIEEIIRREGLVTLPERKASIRLATEAESASIPASFMSPPQLIGNTGQYGEFVLVNSNPSLGDDAQMDDWGHAAITWALTVHEARPGHELQFSSLVENGTSLARAIFAFNSANVEGWGLYAESIMHEFLPLEGQLFNLYSRMVRSARMFLDPMVNTGRLSRDQARDFLIEHAALSKAMASSEADRYAFRLPGQATSYFYGYMKLMALRTEVEIALGGAFDQKVFHDFILEQGLLPPDLLRDAVLDRFVR